MAKLLITGASGFLGESLTAKLSLTHDVLAVARNEGKLLELQGKYPSIRIFSGDIADRSVCEEITKGIDGVYHLAGFKHVRLAEEQPKECISTNTLGSKELLTAISCRNVGFVIGISTDKAAQVAGVYGASKLLMERLFKQFEGFNPQTKFRIVRYGNVLGSTGSVIPKWKELLKRNEPITLTDPTATRFYWTVDRAVDLIFECLAKARDSTPYCPRMKSVALGTLAEAMVEKYGDGVYRVKEIGLQAGENWAETLDGHTFSNEVPRFTKEEIMEMI